MSSTGELTETASTNSAATATDTPSCHSCLQVECIFYVVIGGLITMMLFSGVIILVFILGVKASPLKERYADKLQGCRPEIHEGC